MGGGGSIQNTYSVEVKKLGGNYFQNAGAEISLVSFTAGKGVGNSVCIL